MGQADASGFQIRENSVRNMGRANAGTTVAWGDASVVLNNPAAMVNIQETTVQSDITMIDLTADFDGSGTTALGTPLSGGDGGDPGEATPVPALAAVFPLGEGVVVGASVSAPFGLKTEYEPTWMGRYDALTSDVKVVDLTVSVAYAVTDRFSFGAGIILQNADVTLSKAIDFGTAICAGSGNPMNCFNPAFPFHPQQQDGTIDVTGDDTGTGWVAGMQFKASDAVTLGYAHRSEISHNLKGGVDFTMPASVAAVLAANPAYADGDISAPFETPSTDTVSLRVDVNDAFRLLADAQLTGWTSLQSVVITRDNGATVVRKRSSGTTPGSTRWAASST
jgi:long-chain fatty acid transport protein